MNSQTNKINSNVAAAIIAAFSIAGIFYLQFQFLNNKEAFKSQLKYEQQESWEKTQLKILAQAPTFGFDNLVADWTYYRFLQYFGDKPARRETGYSLLPTYLEVIAKKDPHFVDAYRYLSPVSSIYAGQPQETVHWLNVALKDLSPEVPASHLVWIYKAHDELLLLGDAKAAAHSYQMAAKWASASNNPRYQKSAKNYRKTANFLATNPNSRIPRIASWGMVLRNTRDKQIQQRAIQEIEKLGGKVTVNTEGRLNIKFPQENQQL